jgi:RNA polymerase sigma-70 factor (ECF subfamily)
MNGQHSDFQQAIERVCSGSQEAVWELIETYGPHIKRVVRRRLHQRLRSKFDSLDFVQMVWASFFADRDRIARIREPEELIRYLAAMARNKVVEESRRRMKYQKHNVNRERPLVPNDVGDSKSHHRQETPSQIAIAKERMSHMLRNQSQRNRRIVEMRMNGATYVEISKTLGIHERTARHVIENLQGATAR